MKPDPEPVDPTPEPEDPVKPEPEPVKYQDILRKAAPVYRSSVNGANRQWVQFWIQSPPA